MTRHRFHAKPVNDIPLHAAAVHLIKDFASLQIRIYFMYRVLIIHEIFQKQTFTANFGLVSFSKYCKLKK